MAKQINAARLDGISETFRYERMPDECPICHTSVHPKIVVATLIGNLNQLGSLAQITFQCTKEACQRLFIATYRMGDSTGIYNFVNTAPKTAIQATFSDSITSVSPNFVDIFNQAMAAEAA